VCANKVPHLLPEEVAKRGEVFEGGEWGGEVTSPSSSSSSSSLLSPPKDSGSKGLSSPHALTTTRWHSRPFSFSYVPTTVHCGYKLASRLAMSLGKVTPRGGAACIPQILCKSVHALRSKNWHK
jgi:hypothetical protein